MCVCLFVGGEYPSVGKGRDITVPSPASLSRIVSSPGSMSLPQYSGYIHAVYNSTCSNFEG